VKPVAPPDATWTTVLLHPQRQPRFGAWCHRCGALDVATVGTMRVVRVAERSAAESYAVVPRLIAVPMCVRCRLRPLRTVVVMVLFALVPLALVFPARGAQRVEPLVALSPTARIAAELLWAATGFWLALARRHDRFDAAFDGVNMRYAFLDEWRAVGFARANGGVFAGPPRPERDEHEPDRQTGDHGALDLDDTD
jgi:hypothetical protein